MAKVRKAGKSKRSARAPAGRKTKPRSRSKAASATAARKARARKPRRKQGVVGAMADAVATVADTFQESKDMARKAGARGGLSEG